MSPFVASRRSLSFFPSTFFSFFFFEASLIFQLLIKVSLPAGIARASFFPFPSDFSHFLPVFICLRHLFAPSSVSCSVHMLALRGAARYTATLTAHNPGARFRFFFFYSLPISFPSLRSLLLIHMSPGDDDAGTRFLGSGRLLYGANWPTAKAGGACT